MSVCVESKTIGLDNGRSVIGVSQSIGIRQCYQRMLQMHWTEGKMMREISTNVFPEAKTDLRPLAGHFCVNVAGL